jgi:hypothetical protein
MFTGFQGRILGSSLIIVARTPKLAASPVPKIIDPVIAKTSPKRSFCMTENERFGLVFVKTGSINSGTAKLYTIQYYPYFLNEWT